jgi:hypothetical protein
MVDEEREVKTITDEEYDSLVYYGRDVLSKAWEIAKGDDLEAEYDTNNFYDLIRDGVEAKRRIVEGELAIKEFMALKTEEASSEFYGTLEMVSMAVEDCAKTAEAYDDRVCCDGCCGNNIAEEIRRGK